MGRILRRFKLDELPQFYNILRGEMSIVGPRPKLPQYAGLIRCPTGRGHHGPCVDNLQTRRGDAARHRSQTRGSLLYAQAIKPLKVQLDLCYMCKATLISDLNVIGCTFLSCIIANYVPYAKVRVSEPARGIPTLISIAAPSQSPAAGRTGLEAPGSIRNEIRPLHKTGTNVLSMTSSGSILLWR